MQLEIKMYCHLHHHTQMLKPHWCWVLGLDPGPVRVKHTVYH